MLPGERELAELRLRAEKEPSNLQALLALGAASERAGLYEEAYATWRRALELDPACIPARQGRLRHFRLLYAAERDPYERAATIHRVGETGDRLAVPWLLTLFPGAEPAICQKLAEALGRLRERAAVPALIAVLRDDAACAWWQASQAIAAIGDRAAVPQLVAILASGSAEARAAAAAALGRLGDHSALDPLAGALRDQEPEVRRNAAEAIGALGCPTGMSPLAEALGDADPETRQAAAFALGMLAGRDFRGGRLASAERQARRWWEKVGRRLWQHQA